jgi:hypothetical protein
MGARTTFGGEVKPSVRCRRFTAFKGTLQSMGETLCRPNFPNPVSHPSFSCLTTRWLWLLNRMRVLGLQTSHLQLIRTNLGYGTILTAVGARQGCSATDYYYHYHPFILQFSLASLLSVPCLQTPSVYIRIKFCRSQHPSFYYIILWLQAIEVLRLKQN